MPIENEGEDAALHAFEDELQDLINNWNPHVPIKRLATSGIGIILYYLMLNKFDKKQIAEIVKNASKYAIEWFNMPDLDDEISSCSCEQEEEEK